MRVALIGASGEAGSRILVELAGRGHSVLALARNCQKIRKLPGVVAQAVDANDAPALSGLIEGSDAVISAMKFGDFDGQGLIGAVRAAGIKRYISVGGAGSLQIAPGLLEMDSPK